MLCGLLADIIMKYAPGYQEDLVHAWTERTLVFSKHKEEPKLWECVITRLPDTYIITKTMTLYSSPIVPTKNRHPSTADTHHITKQFWMPKPFLHGFQYTRNPMRHSSCSQSYTNNTKQPRISGHSSTFSARLSTITAGANHLKLD